MSEQSVDCMYCETDCIKCKPKFHQDMKIKRYVKHYGDKASHLIPDSLFQVILSRCVDDDIRKELIECKTTSI